MICYRLRMLQKYMLIILLIFSVAYWIIGMIPVPPPFGNVIKVVLAVILLIWLIYSLLPYSGMGGGLHTLPCR